MNINGDTSVSPFFGENKLKIKIEKDIPIPNNNPSIFKRKGEPKWHVISTMKVGDSFLLESTKFKESDEKLKLQIKAIRSWVYHQRTREGVRIRIVQRKLYLEDGRLAYRIWRTE